MTEDMVMVPVGNGGAVLLDLEKLCSALGAYGIRVGISGEIEALMVKPEGTSWEPVEELPAVVAGQTVLPKRSRRN